MLINPYVDCQVSLRLDVGADSGSGGNRRGRRDQKEGGQTGPLLVMPPLT